ncbi:PQQ-binding-like beta-propeller repeat protein [Nonomuraea sp. NPDC050451]|uniref:PQQ-binding-like beta-propeller repeat protein n=1 Tax=Nonomuraea sp. NPDC050451 TaxID=3364364 RepID=UPI0037A686CF
MEVPGRPRRPGLRVVPRGGPGSRVCQRRRQQGGRAGRRIRALRWNFETGGFGESTAAVSNGMVYVGSANGILYASLA